MKHGISATLAEFAAAQAAQKTVSNRWNDNSKFAAAQAAQKVMRVIMQQPPLFAAAQAADPRTAEILLVLVMLSGLVCFFPKRLGMTFPAAARIPRSKEIPAKSMRE